MLNKLEYYVNNNIISCSLEYILEEYKPIRKKEVLFLVTQLRIAQFQWEEWSSKSGHSAAVGCALDKIGDLI